MEIVTVVKVHSISAGGGGCTIWVPSLGREKETLPERLVKCDSLSASVLSHRRRQVLTFMYSLVSLIASFLYRKKKEAKVEFSVLVRSTDGSLASHAVSLDSTVADVLQDFGAPNTSLYVRGAVRPPWATLRELGVTSKSYLHIQPSDPLRGGMPQKAVRGSSKSNSSDEEEVDDQCAGYYDRRHQIKPASVTQISITTSGDREIVYATFPLCSCGRKQERVAVSKSRNRDQATREVINLCKAHHHCGSVCHTAEPFSSSSSKKRQLQPEPSITPKTPSSRKKGASSDEDAASLSSTFSSLQTQLERLRDENASLRTENGDLKERILHLEGKARSGKAYQAAETARSEEEEAVFDDACTDTWENALGAERTDKTRSIEKVEKALAQACCPKRGTRPVGDDGSARASVAKLRIILQHLLAQLAKPGVDGKQDFSCILEALPTELQETYRLWGYIVDRIKATFDIIKHCRCEDERQDYHVLCASVAAEQAAFGDRDGMNNRVAAEFGLQHRDRESVYVQAARRRAHFDSVALKLSRAIQVGDEIDFVHGNGVVTDISLDGRVSIKTKHGVYDFDSLGTDVSYELPYLHFTCFRNLAGNGRKGARARHAVVSLRPPTRSTRSDALSADVIADIRACYDKHCPTSPCMKDEVRRWLAPGIYETARAQFMFETYDELWVKFKSDFPASAEKIMPSTTPDKCPFSFRVNQPWNLRHKGGDSCLCQTCENCEKHGAARHNAAHFLEEYRHEVERDASGLGGEIIRLLKELALVLRQSRKSQLCAHLTCGEKSGPGATMANRSASCIKGTCENCGFARLWNDGLRLHIVDEDGNLRENAHEVWSKQLRWSRYAYRQREDVADNDAEGDGEEEPDAKEAPKKCELIVEARSGSLFEFLNEFASVASKQVVHRSILDRQKSSTIEFDRERRPGILAIDMDFAENYDIEEARKVQSEHWSKKQCSLFIVVASWLDVLEWNKCEGTLKAGDEVTVHGEQAGYPRMATSFWARVLKQAEGQAVESYEVENARGEKSIIARVLLRRPVVVQQCHAGVTADKMHDSYCMQFFLTKVVDLLRSSGVVASQILTAVCVHSDNAKQHFKSSKSLHFMTSKLAFESATWDFGAPGHGKGVWDGLGGMLKQWLRKRSTSALAAVYNLVMHGTTSVRSARDCYEAWKSHFETEEWRATAEREGKKISTFHFHWAAESGDDSIRRPGVKVIHDSVAGISSGYQFFMLRPGAEVLMRSHSCWCRACFDVATSSAALRPTHLLSSYKVPSCARSIDPLYEWCNKSCKISEGPGAGGLDQVARERGSTLVSKINPGMWLLIEAYGDETDELYLARAWPFFCRDGLRTCVEQHTGGRRHVQGTRFDPGDFKIAVQWYERLSEDGNGERLEFQRGTVAVDLVNSTELRHCGFDVELIEEPRRSRRREVSPGPA